MIGMRTPREYLKDRFNYVNDIDFEEFIELLFLELEQAKTRIENRRIKSHPTIYLDL